jgi:hypothetical protein
MNVRAYTDASQYASMRAYTRFEPTALRGSQQAFTVSLTTLLEWTRSHRPDLELHPTFDLVDAVVDVRDTRGGRRLDP